MAIAASLHSNASNGAASAPVKEQKQLLRFSPSEWAWPLAFLLSLAMVGLRFPLGYLLVPAILLVRFRLDRHDFLIMLTLALGGYGSATADSWGIHTQYFVILAGVVGYVVLKKNKMLDKSMIAWGLYALALIFFASLSELSFRLQFPKICRYLSVIYFVIPLLVFSGKEFDIRQFWRKVMPYVFIMCIFYIIDAAIFSGNVLVPTTHIFNDAKSYFYDLYWNPLSGRIFRKYPPGLYIMVLALLPAARYYRLRVWQWIVIAGGMLVTYTFTFISGMIVGYIICQNNKKLILRYATIGVVILGVLYAVDSKLPTMSMYDTTTYAKPQTTLRIKSSIDQIIDMFKAKDEEDWVVLGTGRFGQAIPKIALLYEEDREWIGFGFLDVVENAPAKYVIYNDLYFEQYSEDNWEVANDIEIMALEVFCTIGFVGLLLHVLYFVYMWFTVRRCRNVGYFLSVLFMFLWLGMTGFEGLTRVMSLYFVGLSYGIVLLTNRPWQLKREHERERKECEAKQLAEASDAAEAERSEA